MATIHLPTLRGSNFLLRPFRFSDALSLCDAMNDERVARKVTHIPFPYTRKHAIAWVREVSDVVTPTSRRVDFAIVRSVDDKQVVLGSVAFINVDGHKAQVSYWLRPDAWGNGIMPEALKLLVRFGFEQMHLERIYAYVYNENRASARVLMKCGFVFEGTHEREWQKKIDGKVCLFDSNYYSIVRHRVPRHVAVRLRDSLPLAPAFVLCIEQHGLMVLKDKADESSADLVLAFGGDGTVMRAIAEFSPLGIPTLGINAGDVGFLTVGDFAHVDTILPAVARGEYQVERRLGLEFMHRKKRIGPIVNDVVLRHPSSVAKYTVSINGVVLYDHISSDGVIVSTPTGSTAYSLSLGGPVMDPRSRDVEVSLMAPMRVSARRHMSAALAHGGEIVVRVDDSKEGKPVGLSADSHEMEILPGESIAIRASTAPLLVGTFGFKAYIEALQKKLGFAS